MGGPNGNMAYGNNIGQYEMQDQPTFGTMQDFFREIESIRGTIRQIEDNVTQIDRLHNRNLQAIGGDTSSRRELESITADTRSLQNRVRTAMRILENQYAQIPANHPDRPIRRQQMDNIKRRFMDQTKRYMQIEQTYQERSRARARRQLEIASPDATEEEIEQCLDTGNDAIFANAVLRSNRSGEARSALREVQARHQEIQKIERTMAELAQLMQDMAMMVEEQSVDHVEQAAVNVAEDMEVGNVHMDKAIASAKAARRKKWWCFIIMLVILGIIAIILATTLSQKFKK